MSGGVDSSTAAAILKEEGLDVVGFSMQLWDQRRNPAGGDESGAGRCCSIDDLYDAREVAARLGFPFYVVDLQKEFESTVVRSFVEELPERSHSLSLCAVQFTAEVSVPGTHGERGRGVSNGDRALRPNFLS